MVPSSFSAVALAKGNRILAALAVLLLAAMVDQLIQDSFPQGSQSLSIFELRSGANVPGQARIEVRRDHVAEVLRLVVDPSNPLALSPDEFRFVDNQLDTLEGLLSQVYWSALRLAEGLESQHEARLHALWAQPLVRQTAMRAGEQWVVNELTRAFPALPAGQSGSVFPAGWDPVRDDPEAFEGWVAFKWPAEVAAMGDNLLDFNAAIVVTVMLLDQNEHPDPDSKAAALRGYHARNLITAAVELRRQWPFTESMLRQGGGAARARAMPAVARGLRAGGRDISLEQFFQVLQETREALRQRR